MIMHTSDLMGVGYMTQWSTWSTGSDMVNAMLTLAGQISASSSQWLWSSTPCWPRGRLHNAMIKLVSWAPRSDMVCAMLTLGEIRLVHHHYYQVCWICHVDSGAVTQCDDEADQLNNWEWRGLHHVNPGGDLGCLILWIFFFRSWCSFHQSISYML